MNRFASCACVAALISAFSVPSSAQDAAADPAAADPPAHIAIVDGVASLERDGRPDPAPASMPLLAGDRLRTENGRVEVLFADGATLHLDSSSTVDFQSDEVIRLIDGRVRLTIPGPRRGLSYRIDAPAGWVQIVEPGEYRIAVKRSGQEPEVELVVLRGAADLLNEDGQTTLRAGERAFARAGTAPSYAYVYNSAAWDAFDRWSDSRRADRAGASAEYLPETVRSYSSTFDGYGSWRYDTSYGNVWYPTVSAEWRPYFNGRWSSFPSYGWTWIGTDAWAWPTHHYGRWGFSAGAWFWIPGRTWGPAWVSWAYAPGYVSWCPLGWDNRAVLQFGRGGYGRYDPWNAWTVVAHQRFGSGYVNRSFIGGSRIDVRTRGAFVVRSGGPDSRGYAVPRNAAPIRVAGSRGAGSSGFAGGAGRTPVERSGDGRARASVNGAPAAARRGDDAGAFRSRGAAAAPSNGPGFPAPARAPRQGADVVDRMGASRERPNASRSADNAGVAVSRGAVPRQSDRPADFRQPADSDQRRLDVPGYRRAPSAPQSGSQQRTWSSGDVPVYRGGRVTPERQPNDRQPTDRSRAVPRQAPQSTPSSASPQQRTWSTGERQAPPSRYESTRPDVPVYRGGRVAPERQPNDRQPNDQYRAVPRQAPQSAPPAYRPYGGAERRAPSGPPPSAAPPRESRPSGGAPRGESPSRARPSGEGQQDRGGASRRPGGRG